MLRNGSYKDLLNWLERNPNINFVGRAITPWHAIGVDAAIKYLQNQGKSMNGLCLVLPHKQTGFSCREDVFLNNVSEKMCLDIQASGLSDFFKKIVYYFFLFFGNKSSGSDFYIIGSQADAIVASIAYRFFPKRRFKFILVDEGVAAYMGTLKRKKPKVKSLSSLIDVVKYFHFYYMGTVFVAKHHDIKDCRLLKKIGERLAPNDFIIPFYKQAISERKNTFLERTISIDKERTFVICTTAWARDKIEDDEDLRVLKIVCDSLHHRGFDLLLKTHPRDSFFSNHAEELHCKPIDLGRGSMESICAQISFKGVISFSSTVLVTAKLLYGISSYCLSDMLCRDKINSFYLEEIDSFKKTFFSNVSFISNAREIDYV